LLNDPLCTRSLLTVSRTPKPLSRYVTVTLSFLAQLTSCGRSQKRVFTGESSQVEPFLSVNSYNEYTPCARTNPSKTNPHLEHRSLPLASTVTSHSFKALSTAGYFEYEPDITSMSRSQRLEVLLTTVFRISTVANSFSFSMNQMIDPVVYWTTCRQY
jgi:hypothetical protein